MVTSLKPKELQQDACISAGWVPEFEYGMLSCFLFRQGV